MGEGVVKVVSYRHEGKHGVGVVSGATDCIALTSAAPDLPNDLRRILESIRRCARAGGPGGKIRRLSLDDIAFDPVIREPHATWALALNYKLHIKETGLTTSQTYPQIFLRMPICQVGHREPLWAPRQEDRRSLRLRGRARRDHRQARPLHHARRGASTHVAGYSCYNEGSVREYQGHNRQFGLGKNFERSGSFGPWLMTPDEFGDPAEHR